MINTDEDSLICDLAETYHIYDYRSLPLKTVAALSVGLRANSRIKMKINNMDLEPETYLLSAIVDRLSVLVWRQTKDGAEGINPPKLILNSLVERETIGFSSIDEFERFREKILEGAL